MRTGIFKHLNAAAPPAVRAVFFILLMCRPALAFNDPVTGAISDLGYMGGAPARLNSSSVYQAAGFIGAGLLVYSMDGQIRHIASKNRNSSLDSISKQVEKLGNGGYDLAITGAGALCGYLASDKKLEKTSFLAMRSFLAANAAGLVAKYSFGRSRPYAEEGKKTFHPFNIKTARTSFPSGHTISAFSVASVYAGAYGDSFWPGAAAYGLAGLVGLQRIYSDKHWASDVFFGGLLGTVVGRTVAAREKNSFAAAASFVPVYAKGYTGALASLKF